ncbi:hypothetical protein MSAN_01549400 [Mycena sanguinolenta]|uniref:Uncharacterized protein n=1 Tax=Mycena sanguinolenta TaxID=230812 RepID=A0A8H6Y3T0_9AGAR|nr:hypothetical protein MSAN_01549400 [Mycena sanguinolenta]
MAAWARFSISSAQRHGIDPRPGYINPSISVPTPRTRPQLYLFPSSPTRCALYTHPRHPLSLASRATRPTEDLHWRSFSESIQPSSSPPWIHLTHCTGFVLPGPRRMFVLVAASSFEPVHFRHRIKTLQTLRRREFRNVADF